MTSTTSTELSTILAREAMRVPLVAVGPAVELPEVATLMAEHRVHAVIVDGIEHEHLVWGVVSALDLLRAAVRDDLSVTAGEIAATPIVTVDSDDDLQGVSALMAERGTDHVVVVSGGRPVGVISALDIVSALKR